MRVYSAEPTAATGYELAGVAQVAKWITWKTVLVARVELEPTVDVPRNSLKFYP